MNNEVVSKDALKVRALTNRVAQFVAAYEDQIADLNAQYEIVVTSLQNEIQSLRAQLEATDNDVSEEGVAVHVPDSESSPVEYPSGIAVRTESGVFFINKDGKRYRIPTERILSSWNFPFVVPTSEAAVSKYPVAVNKLGFRDGSLLNNIADGRIYLVSGGRLRHITDPAVLARLGNPKPLVVSDAEIKLMKQGESII